MLDLVVIGGGLSGLAGAFEARRRGWNTLVLEGSSRFGGVLQTSYDRNWVLELGAESMLSNKAAGPQLARDLDLADQLVETQSEYRATYILRHGKLRRIPQGFRLMAPADLGAFARSDVISLWGKLRMGLDLVIPRRRSEEDETLASFVARRFGRECLDRLAQPMIAGIYTASPESLGMQAILPQFLQFEKTRGSVLRGLWRSPEALQASGPRSNLFVSFKRGFQQLIDRLVEVVGRDSLRHQSVLGLERAGDHWEVVTEEGRLAARRVLVAGPAWMAAPWFPGPLGDELAAIEHLNSAAVMLAYPSRVLHDPTRAFGFVVPAVEHRQLLACTYCHRKYPGRCPDDVVLLRAYVGGADNPRVLDWSDEQMVGVCHFELSHLLGIGSPPEASWVNRFPRRMPVYGLRHRQRVARILREARSLPNLALAGNYLDGVGMPDCIRVAREAVANLG